MPSRNPEREAQIRAELARLQWERLPVMSPAEFAAALKELDLTQADCAYLMGTSPRTVRRWCEEGPVPGPADTVIRGWLLMKNRNVYWKPLK